MLSERIETPKRLKKQRDTKHSRERDTYKTCNQKETRCTTKHETIDMRPFSSSIFLSLLPPGWLEDCVNRVSVGMHASVQRTGTRGFASAVVVVAAAAAATAHVFVVGAKRPALAVPTLALLSLVAGSL